MPYSDLYPGETDAALAERITSPVPKPPPPPSAWASAGNLLLSPFTGAAKGINETLRVAAGAAHFRIRPDERPQSGPLSPIEEMRQESLRKNEENAAAADAFFRRGAEYWNLDPATAGGFSSFFHEIGRMGSKIAGYTVLGGAPGAVVGTSLDEGVTTFKSLRDRGVDPETAAKVGVTHGAFTAVQVAIPAAAATKLGTAALVAGTGPGAYMGETAAARAILEAAQYPEIAAENDPTDPLGLAMSLIPGALVGTVVHGARARSARLAGLAPQTAAVIETAAERPEVVDAAHVQLQREVAHAGMLGRPNDPQARIDHARAMQDARAALDEGRPIELAPTPLDAERMRGLSDEVGQRMRDSGYQTAEPQVAPPFVPPELGPAAPQVLPDDPVAAFAPGDPQPRANVEAEATVPAGPVQRAQALAAQRPDLPVRLDDDGTAARPVGDVLGIEREAAQREAAEAQHAIATAIECFLKVGT